MLRFKCALGAGVLGAAVAGCGESEMAPLPDLPHSAKQTTVTPDSGPVIVDLELHPETRPLHMRAMPPMPARATITPSPEPARK